MWDSELSTLFIMICKEKTSADCWLTLQLLLHFYLSSSAFSPTHPNHTTTTTNSSLYFWVDFCTFKCKLFTSNCYHIQPGLHAGIHNKTNYLHNNKPALEVTGWLKKRQGSMLLGWKYGSSKQQKVELLEPSRLNVTPLQHNVKQVAERHADGSVFTMFHTSKGVFFWVTASTASIRILTRQ